MPRAVRPGGRRIVTGREYAPLTKERGRPMEQLEITGNVAGTALVFAPTGDGRLLMTVGASNTSPHGSVVLQPGWLRPLAAWLAGDARPGTVGHDEYGMPYGRWLTITGDETAVVYGVHVRAELTCRLPFGTSHIAIGPRDRATRYTVVLSPGARSEAAAYLRRTDAAHWADQFVR